MSEMLQGRAVSLWLATAAGTGYPSLRTDLDVDIAVIGGGVAGLTAALALKRAGQSVAVSRRRVSVQASPGTPPAK